MYQKPELNCVGKAQDVILGCAIVGGDMDTTWMNGQNEFAFDGDDLDRPVPQA
jgi:hypothetical protein